ncbi:MAG: helix-turn-helix domain-containing protein [Hyphomicrobiaceae bacterium]
MSSWYTTRPIAERYARQALERLREQVANKHRIPVNSKNGSAADVFQKKDGTVEKEWLQLNEVAALIGVPVGTLKRWCWEGRGPKHGNSPGRRRIFFRRSDVLAWLERSAESMPTLPKLPPEFSSLSKEDDLPDRIDAYLSRMRAKYPQFKFTKKSALRALLHKALRADEKETA